MRTHEQSFAGLVYTRGSGLSPGSILTLVWFPLEDRWQRVECLRPRCHDRGQLVLGLGESWAMWEATDPFSFPGVSLLEGCFAAGCDQFAKNNEDKIACIHHYLGLHLVRSSQSVVSAPPKESVNLILQSFQILQPKEVDKTFTAWDHLPACSALVWLIFSSTETGYVPSPPKIASPGFHHLG